jgi:hypothetical protein
MYYKAPETMIHYNFMMYESLDLPESKPAIEINFLRGEKPRIQSTEVQPVADNFGSKSYHKNKKS